MLARITSIALRGLEAIPITVEVDTRRGMPHVAMVGLAEAAVREAIHRVKSAIRNSDHTYWKSWITVNLAPSDVRKEGTHYDLAIAIGLLHASDELSVADAPMLARTVMIGELSLDGAVRHVRGIVPMVLGAKQRGFERVFVSHDSVSEAALIRGIAIVGVKTLQEAIGIVQGTIEPRPIVSHPRPGVIAPLSDIADIRGQEQAKRVLEIAAAGGHNVLFAGSPGSGKTMLARALVSLLPPLSDEESIEVTALHSLAGLLVTHNARIYSRPFRSPHHTASTASLVGGGRIPRPGEISLAHRGVLFLDELPEYAPATLEALRQPLESGVITITRAQQSLTYPAQCMLVAAMNPCPCGFASDASTVCTCTPYRRIEYQRKISGPLRDRMDLFLDVLRVPIRDLAAGGTEQAESSPTIAARVQRARDVQSARLGQSRTNSTMTVSELRRDCALTSIAQQLLHAAAERMQLSARGYHRVLKVARTIADLAGARDIADQHIAEAVQYRSRLTQRE